MDSFLKNYCTTLFFLLIAYLFYTNPIFYNNPKGYFTLMFGGGYSLNFINFKISTHQVFFYLALFYSIILIPYYAYYKDIVSKFRILLEYISDFKFSLFGKKEKQAILVLAVKFFFVPLMVNWLIGHIFSLINNFHALFYNYDLSKIGFLELFNSNLFWTLFSMILFFDVFFFTIGYLIEIPKLKNEIISVEPTIFGWAVCLLCYPPFNEYTTKIIGWSSTDFPKFNDPYIHVILNVFILILMGIYTSASISLNFKASNLTNRGIVSSGVYKFVRHPAYICKNLAWWIGGIPAIIISINSPKESVITVVLSLCAWSFIYYLRAITEERHLLKANNGYKEYIKKVKYRFIPGVI